MTCKSICASDFFECTQCGDCCQGYGGTYVTDTDIEAIAHYIKKSVDVIRDQYCAMSGNKRLLAQGQDKRCIFWDKICTIHPVKPRMCRMWPFIPSLLVDIGNWQIMAASCPGIKTDVDEISLKAYVTEALGGKGDDSIRGCS